MLCHRWPVSAEVWTRLGESSFVNTPPHQDRTSSGSDSYDCWCSSWPIRSGVFVRSYLHCCRYNVHIHPSTPGTHHTASSPGKNMFSLLLPYSDVYFARGHLMQFKNLDRHIETIKCFLCSLLYFVQIKH